MFTPDRELIQEAIERRAAEDLASGRVGACEVLVAQDHKILYRNNFGETVPGSGIAPDDRTLFRLASMTKPITAVAALIACDRGVISLDDAVAKYLPAFADPDVGALDDRKKVTVVGKAKTVIRLRHLLTHTSGIGSGDLWLPQYLAKTPEQKKTLATMVDAYAGDALAFEPFTRQAYSATAAFDVLARIIELTTDTPFEAFLKKEIFEPLGMTDTTFAPTEEQWSRMIPMHGYLDGKAVLAPFPKRCVFSDFPTTYTAAGAGLASTMEDYRRFADFLLSEGKTPDGKVLLPAERIREMRTPQVPAEVMAKPSHSWGLGVRVIVGENRLPIGSYGWSGAYGGHFWIDPENRVYAIYLKNSTYDGGSGAVTAANFETDVYAGAKRPEND